MTADREPRLHIPADYRPARDLLAGRVVLVTGAGSGIGAAAARALGAHGATVVLLDRNVRRLESVYDDILAAGGPEPAIQPMDLAGAEPAHYEALAGNLADRLGGLDGLVHNAADLGTLTPLDHYPIDEWARVLQVNLNAPFLLTRACLPLLRRSADARLLFTGADVGRRGRAYWGAYAVTKSAGDTLMEVLADELESNTRVRVNSIDPGPVRTTLRAAAYPAEDRAALRSPDEVAVAHLFLMGPEGARAHGRRLRLERAADGGWDLAGVHPDG